MEKMITTYEEMQTLLQNAKCGGQFVSLSVSKPYDLKKGGRMGLAPINPTFTPYKHFSVVYHFGEDYDNKVAKLMAQGKETPTYDAEKRANIEHLVPHLMMRYISTGNICLIAMPTAYKALPSTLNGVELNAEQMQYLETYKKASKPSTLPYLTIGAKHITRITIAKETYIVAIR